MEKAMSARIGELKLQPYSQLCQLPAYSQIVQHINNWKYSISTYYEKLKDGRIQIVIQAYHYVFLGIGTMWADGFLKSEDDTTTPLPDNTRWDYS